MISIVDYGVGNIGSIVNMLRRLGCSARVVATPGQMERAESIILPGVGAFDCGMQALAERGLIEILRRKALVDHTPMLGICLGMQLLGRSSEEGHVEGLGLIDARFVKFRAPAASTLKVPHMGWNTVELARPSPLLDDDGTEKRFYFVHSYHAECADPADVIAWSRHGVAFPAAYGRDNVYGVQFHPEKSHRFGLSVLEKFSRLDAEEPHYPLSASA